MEFAYLDESGDLGSGPRSSKYLIVCLVCTRQRKKLNKIIRKTKQRLLRRKKTGDWLNRNGGEIKFYKFPDKNLLIKALKEISNLDLKIYYICFNKRYKKLDKKLKEDILLYLFCHIFKNPNKENPQKIISDRDFLGETVNLPSYFLLDTYQKDCIEKLGSDGHKINKLRDFIKFKIISPEEYKVEQKNKDKFLIKVEPIPSSISDELQAIDLICGSIFQYRENNNSEYINIIKNKIEMEDEI